MIGVLSILSGIFYTAGARPLGYLGLGEIFVFIFFGPVAVAGTYYVQSLEINSIVILGGLGPGFLSMAILVVNNLRDIKTDKKSNKKTLAVRFGETFARCEYLGAILAAALTPVLIFIIAGDDFLRNILPSMIVCFLAIPTINTVFTKTDGPSLNHALAQTARLLLIYSILFSAGWIL